MSAVSTFYRIERVRGTLRIVNTGRPMSVRGRVHYMTDDECRREAYGQTPEEAVSLYREMLPKWLANARAEVATLEANERDIETVDMAPVPLSATLEST